MTWAEFYDDVFRVATGWLGWSAEQALTTPIPQIQLAVEGLMEFKRKTNPFASPEKAEKPRQQQSVGGRLKAMFRARGTKRGD